MKVINPATGQFVREYAEHSPAEVEEKIRRAERVYQAWRNTSIEARASAMMAAARVLRERRTEYARMMTEEMGKPIRQSDAEIGKCAWVCEFYAEHAESFLATQPTQTDAARSYVRFDPIGPVLAIMPWNFPFWQLFRFAAPALMAGNVGLLKHASNVPGCAMAIEQVFRDAGFPAGAMTTLLVDSERTAEVIKHPAVKAVTLTGSERAGQAVAADAGRAIKKTVLELGGSDPFIVLADADVQQAAEVAVAARTINSGQSCIAAKRFIVERSVLEEFTAEMVSRMESLNVGDPTDPDTDIGPLAREDLRESLHDQVTRSIDAGAKLLCGGKPLAGDGYFYPPTMLTDVRPGMAAFDEETFGPVAAVIDATDAKDAVRLANDSTFGLGASLWTGNLERGEQLATEIDCGCVFINELVKSDPRVPFGGVKRSGYGRELGEFGIREFVNIKTVWIR